MAAELGDQTAGRGHVSTGRAARVWTTLRGEVAFVQVAIGLVALHVLDDSYLQPAPGTSARDHIASGLVPLAVFALVVLTYPCLRAGARAGVALVCGVIGIAVGGSSAYYLARGDASGEEYTGVLAIAAGLALVAIAPAVLWRSRRSAGTRGRRYLRRTLRTVAVAVALPLVGWFLVLPIGEAYLYTHAGRTAMTPDIGVLLERVTVTTGDSLELAAWYVPSANRAAVVLYPGADRRLEARMLIRHGYGVLLLEPRGQGGSQGDVNRWAGDRDLRAAAAYLADRPDVDSGRIGAIGFSIGGEILLEAAAQSPAYAAVVAEGAGERFGGMDSSGPRRLLMDPAQALLTAAATVLSNQGPPPPIEDRIGLISPRAVMLIHAEHGQGGENTRSPRYYAAAKEPKAIWRVPGATHTEGISARPAEYETRVIGFLDRALLKA